jgi:hypothetical protein
LQSEPKRAESVYEEIGYYREEKQLLEPSRNIGKDTIDHIRRTIGLGVDKIDRATELQGLKDLHEKYPCAGFNKYFSERRFKTLDQWSHEKS